MGLLDNFVNARNKFILQVKRLRNEPDIFMFVQKDQNGKYVLPKGYSSVREFGEIREVVHMTLHDMVEHAIYCMMTDLKYLTKSDANAVYLDNQKFERLDQYNGKSYFQPLKLDK